MDQFWCEVYIGATDNKQSDNGIKVIFKFRIIKKNFADLRFKTNPSPGSFQFTRNYSVEIYVDR